jgi:hypothetical protein
VTRPSRKSTAQPQRNQKRMFASPISRESSRISVSCRAVRVEAKSKR